MMNRMAATKRVMEMEGGRMMRTGVEETTLKRAGAAKVLTIMHQQPAHPAAWTMIVLWITISKRTANQMRQMMQKVSQFLTLLGWS